MYAKERKQDTFLPSIELNKKIESKRMTINLLSILFVALEGLALTLIYFLYYAWRIHLEFNVPLELFELANPRFSYYLYFYIIFALVYGFLTYKYRLHTFIATSGLIDEILKSTRALSYAIVLAVGLGFLFKLTDLSRIVIILFWFSAIGTNVILRFLKRRLYLSLNQSGLLSRSVVIIGAGKVGTSLIEEFQQHKWLGYHVVGYIDDSVEEPIAGIPCLGPTGKIREIFNSNLMADEIIITIPSERPLVQSIIADFRKSPIEIKVIPDMFNLVLGTVQVGNINSLPTVSLVRTPMRGYGLWLKRLVDYTLTTIAFVLTLPITLFTAVCIKCESKGPIFYKQTRVGKNGKLFYMYKFRSMVQDADQLITKLAQENEVEGIAFKMKNDPRITRVGRFIRKYSIDELPQLLNVLKGDMSLIGPRPPLEMEVEHYSDWEWRRLEVLPGITGLWQVSGRSDLSFQQWMNLDVYYIENWSLTLDIKILLKTIPVVLKGEGAY
ncbi:sugar transferase [Paenibacillus marinisediminis]